MLISRHKQATTTPKISAAIQASAGPAGLLFCINRRGELPLVERLPDFSRCSSDAGIVGYNASKDGDLLPLSCRGDKPQDTVIFRHHF